MPLSENTKKWLLAPFSICSIMRWGALPGIVGMVLIAIGVMQQIRWLKVFGLVLAAPVIWCFFVIICIFLPFAILDSLNVAIGNRIHGKKK